MSERVENLYSPRKAAELFDKKPGHHIVGQESWNRARDKMTLADVKRYDDENHRLILKECKEYRFGSLPECAAAKWMAWAWAMKRLGIKVVEDMGRDPNMVRRDTRFFEKRLEVEMKNKDVRCEERPPKEINVEADLWQSGMYVYYHGDIVYFISNPMKVRAREGQIYLASRSQVMIVTNARPE